MLFSEIPQTRCSYANICAIFLLNAVDKDVFEKHALNFLADKNSSDEKKFFIISLLKQKGIGVDYDSLSEYIENPEQLAKNGVKDFLKNAICDPEVQIDLLDFYLNIADEEKIYLIRNLIADYEGDNLSNALSLLSNLNLNKEETKLISEGLCSTSSYFALEGLKNLLNSSFVTQKEKNKINKKIKEINFKFPCPPKNPITLDSRIFQSVVSFCDGESNFSFVLARKYPNDSIDTFLLTLNLQYGLVSCMGFGNINDVNLSTLLNRLFSDSLPVEIKPEIMKSLIKQYIDKNLSTSSIVPYEYFVWKKLLDDIEDIDFDIDKFLSENTNKISMSSSKVKKFLNAKIVETWYYIKGQNQYIDEIIDVVEELNSTDIAEIEKKIAPIIKEKFIKNEKFMDLLREKLRFQALAAYFAKLAASASCSYHISKSDKYLETVINSIVEKSIYAYLNSVLVEDDVEKNVFRKIGKKTKFTKTQLEELMQKLEDKWS